MIVHYEGVDYVVEIINRWPPVLDIDGELHSMEDALCKGIQLQMIRDEFADNSITYGNITRSQVNEYYFDGLGSESDLDKVMPIVRGWA